MSTEREYSPIPLRERGSADERVPALAEPRVSIPARAIAPRAACVTGCLVTSSRSLLCYAGRPSWCVISHFAATSKPITTEPVFKEDGLRTPHAVSNGAAADPDILVCRDSPTSSCPTPTRPVVSANYVVGSAYTDGLPTASS